MGTKLSKIAKSQVKNPKNKQNIKDIKENIYNNVTSPSKPPIKKDSEDIKFDSMLKEISKSIKTIKTPPVYSSERVAEVKKIIADQKKVLQKQRISTGHLKAILNDKDLNNIKNLEEKKSLIYNLAKKYDVDETCLTDVLYYYRIPPIFQRYDGYLVGKAWQDDL